MTVTDCKSLHDTVHKEGCAMVPTEKRPALDLAALRQMYHEECTGHDAAEVLAAGTYPLVWVPTAEMAADPMTKPMGACYLRGILTG
eukprot:4633947-Alexandrium_andersonii.AAC.1